MNEQKSWSGGAKSKVLSPKYDGPQAFTDPDAAVAEVTRIYEISIKFLQKSISQILSGKKPAGRYRAFYPKLSLTTASHAHIDNRLSFGHVHVPGAHETTLTRPDLFKGYLTQQIALVMRNYSVPVVVSISDTPIPVHFAMSRDVSVSGFDEENLPGPLRDYFDVPDLATTNDDIVNGKKTYETGEPRALAPFTAQRVDYSLARLSHYTATDPEHFQNHVLFTNYQFYVEEFARFGCAEVKDPNSGYDEFIFPGNVSVTCDDDDPQSSASPQMPAYHLKRKDGSGITMVNIGVGPSNAKTATDHIAVLRPHAWLMLGHCAGLRHSQNLGDYVLAHAYVREDKVLDADLPVWVPIPALAEIQIALEKAVADVTGLNGYELKSVMRTGTVASIDNRNWELQDNAGPIHRLSQSRAIALDMESATVAANGFRFRVPYGTLLCVSDKPLHGELKLPGMATAFYQRQVAQHLQIGIRAMESLREMPLARLHSRKLRSFDETAFL